MDGKEEDHQVWRKLAVVKKFTGGYSGASVHLVQSPNPGGEPIVRKRYGKGIWTKLPWFTEQFKHEIKILTRLRGCSFVPQLLHVDKKHQTIYITYCGTPAPDTPEVRKVLAARVAKLKKKYGVWRRLGGSVWLPNVCIKNGHLFLIDFASKEWRMDHR